MTKTAKPATTAPEALMLDIAKRHFFVETLDTRNSDGLDFHDVAVWSIRAALIEAYSAGLAAAPALRGVKDMTMAITTIRIDYSALPEGFDLSRPDAIAEVIEQALRESGIPADASDVLSHLKIELPTAQLGAASRTLAEMRLI